MEMCIGKMERGSVHLVWELVPSHMGREMPLQWSETGGTEEKSDSC